MIRRYRKKGEKVDVEIRETGQMAIIGSNGERHIVDRELFEATYEPDPGMCMVTGCRDEALSGSSWCREHQPPNNRPCTINVATLPPPPRLEAREYVQLVERLNTVAAEGDGSPIGTLDRLLRERDVRSAS